MVGGAEVFLRLHHLLDDFERSAGHVPSSIRVAPGTLRKLHAEITGVDNYAGLPIKIGGVPIEEDRSVPPGHAYSAVAPT